MNQKNNAFLTTGTITSPFIYSHKTERERFYTSFLSIRRYSGTTDTVPILISDRVWDMNSDMTGKRVLLSGCFRSHNHVEENHRKLQLFLFISDLVPADEDMIDRNEVLLQGNICQHPVYRVTPKGREITNLLLAVPRDGQQNDYIPLIVWGNNARTAGKLLCGDRLSIHGRIQSREYKKQLEDSRIETRTTYEVSVSHLVASSRNIMCVM